MFAVAGEDVGQGDRHVEAPHVDLEVAVAFGVAVVEHRLAQQTAGSHFESAHPQPAVEVHGPTGDEAGDPLLHQHTAVDRPDRLDPVERDHPAIDRRRAEPPGELTVLCPEAVHVAVRRTEQQK